MVQTAIRLYRVVRCSPGKFRFYRLVWKARSDLVGSDPSPNVRHQSIHKEQVMLAGQGHEERLVLLEKVMEIGA